MVKSEQEKEGRSTCEGGGEKVHKRSVVVEGFTFVQETLGLGVHRKVHCPGGWMGGLVGDGWMNGWMGG